MVDKVQIDFLRRWIQAVYYLASLRIMSRWKSLLTCRVKLI